MEKIDLQSLRKIMIENFLGISTYQKCIDWAIEQLLRGVEDENVCILASSNINNLEEIKTYLQKITENEPNITQEELYESSGAIIVKVGQEYLNGFIGLKTLENILDNVYINLGHPNWLVMLTRNCEYATDIEYFMEPFIKELNYIISLWSEFPKYEVFGKKYDRNISNSHDFA